MSEKTRLLISVAALSVLLVAVIALKIVFEWPLIIVALRHWGIIR